MPGRGGNLTRDLVDHDITPESGYYLSLDKVGADCIDNIKLPTQNNLVSTTTMREGLRTQGCCQCSQSSDLVERSKSLLVINHEIFNSIQSSFESGAGRISELNTRPTSNSEDNFVSKCINQSFIFTLVFQCCWDIQFILDARSINCSI